MSYNLRRVTRHTFFVPSASDHRSRIGATSSRWTEVFVRRVDEKGATEGGSQGGRGGCAGHMVRGIGRGEE